MGILECFSFSKETLVVVKEGEKPSSTKAAIQKETSESSIPPIIITAPTLPESDSVPTSPVTATQSNTQHKKEDGKASPKDAQVKPSKPLLAVALRKKKQPEQTPAHTSHKDYEHKPALTEPHEHEKRSRASSSLMKRLLGTGKAHNQAKKSALLVRSLIVGPSASNPKITPAYAKPRLNKIKSQLSKPKSANEVIAQLRALPIADFRPGVGGSTFVPASAAIRSQGPIHAVCLAHPEAEVRRLHFAAFTKEQGNSSAEPEDIPWFAFPDALDIDVSLDKLIGVFNDMKIIDLLTAPDLGIGQPGDGPGLLAGSVPTAETVMKGIEAITPQLMALGYATGKAIVPDHSGIHPPTDRLSVLTYWWGLELAMPTPTIQYLSSVRSVAGTIMNFLTALALVNNGVREIMPFVRYISQYVDWEFSQIKAQDKGKGVICAATWIMPAALVPRPWDFPDLPAQPTTGSEEPVAAPPTASPSQPSSPSTPVQDTEPSSPSPPSEEALVDQKLPIVPVALPPISLVDAVDKANASAVPTEVTTEK